MAETLIALIGIALVCGIAAALEAATRPSGHLHADDQLGEGGMRR